MNTTSRPLRRAALALGALAVAVGTLAAPTAAVALGQADRPVVGSCHTITLDEVADLADSDAAVDCSKKHTSRTIHVSDLPDGVEFSDTEATGEVVSKRCHPAWQQAVGGTLKTRYLAMLSYVWYQPTKAQIADGARWFRCDLVLFSAHNVEPLPTGDEPVITGGKVPNSVAKCHLGKNKGYQPTVCTKAHEYRSKGTFTMSGKKYPSEQARMKAASKKCPRVAGTQQWLVTWPTEDQWKAGFKLFLCDAKTKH